MATQPQTASTGTAPVVKPAATTAAPPTKGTITTAQGPITWEKAADGSITAVGNGQQFTSHGHVNSDGSTAWQANYAKTGQTSYLAFGLTGDPTKRTVQVLVTGGSSKLTLAVSGIDAAGTSGMAILSGIVNGAAVKWSGQVNLSSNPFTTQTIAGWPKGAFAAEFQMAAFFTPLGDLLAQQLRAAPVGHITPHDTPSVGAVFARAEIACFVGAALGSETGPGALLVCAGAAVVSVANDVISWQDSLPPEPVSAPPPVISLPPDPEPTGPVTVTQPDGSGDGSDDGGGDGGSSGVGDGSGDGGGSGGGGHGIDKPPTEED
jgi:uncharacterized membrane protein YgcG